MLVTDPGITAARGGRPGELRRLPRAALALGPEAVAVGRDLAAGRRSTSGASALGSGVIRGAGGAQARGCSAFLVALGLRPRAGRLVEPRCRWSRSGRARSRWPAALIGGMIAAFFSLGGWWDVEQDRRRGPRPRRHAPAGPAPGRRAGHARLHAHQPRLPLPGPARADRSREAFAALAGEALFGRAGGVVFSVIVIVTVRAAWPRS